ncbi:MAG: DUF4062 domain-containing protein, partial [Hyphomicrobium aestuarii]|nr:DUF4062 domain-containing protein [Hyphomicrobium aestuarii]
MSSRRMTVFLSSTEAEFEPFRDAIIAHMATLDHFLCDHMRNFGSRDSGAVALCHERVRGADVLLGLTGFYRGWEPPGDNRQRSITEMEYDWAADGDTSRLMFVLPDDKAMAAPAQPPELAARQKVFRSRVLADNTVDQRILRGDLADPANFAAAVMTALANITYRELIKATQASASVLAGQRPPATAAPLAQKRSIFGWLFGSPTAATGRERDIAAYQKTRTPGQLPPPPAPVAKPVPSPDAPADIAPTLAAFAADPAYAALFADPAAFDIAKLEAAVVARGDERQRVANDQLQSERRAAASDYSRLAELTGFFDIEKARRYWGLAYAADPTDGFALHQYAERCVASGRTAEAEAAFARFDPVAAAAANLRGAYWAQLGYGDLCCSQGDLTLASQAFVGARDIANREAKANPSDLSWQRDLSVSHERIGNVLVAQGNLPAALKAFNAALAIAQRLATADPGN